MQGYELNFHVNHLYPHEALERSQKDFSVCKEELGGDDILRAEIYIACITTMVKLLTTPT